MFVVRSPREVLMVAVAAAEVEEEARSTLASREAATEALLRRTRSPTDLASRRDRRTELPDQVKVMVVLGIIGCGWGLVGLSKQKYFPSYKFTY